MTGKINRHGNRKFSYKACPVPINDTYLDYSPLVSYIKNVLNLVDLEDTYLVHDIACDGNRQKWGVYDINNDAYFSAVEMQVNTCDTTYIRNISLNSNVYSSLPLNVMLFKNVSMTVRLTNGGAFNI